ncbi:MAG: hypothetical protein ACI841_000605 [Planctomycetota bacterium]|jgi:hypothetical protein
MNKATATAVLRSIQSSKIDEEHLTIHSTDATHMEKTTAISLSTARTRDRCGYFQWAETKKTTVTTDAAGWNLAKPIVTFVPTGSAVDLDIVQSKRLVKAFFAQSSLTPKAGAGNSGSIEGPIPTDYYGYTNTAGVADHARCYNMRVVIAGGGASWQIITLYPIV